MRCLRADIIGFRDCVRISWYNVSSTVISGAAYQGTYDCITIPTFQSLLRAVYFCLWTDNGLTINHRSNHILAYRYRSLFLCAMTNSSYSSRDCKKGDCNLQGLIPDASAFAGGDVLFNSCLFSFLKKVMPIVKLTDYETK